MCKLKKTYISTLKENMAKLMFAFHTETSKENILERNFHDSLIV